MILKSKRKKSKLEWAADVLTSTVEPGAPGVPSHEERLGALATIVESGRVDNYSKLLPLIFNLNGKPYSLEDHFAFEPLYNKHLAESTVIVSGRQVSKSTNQAARGLLISTTLPYFTTLFVTPLYEQVRKFSTEYVAKFIEESPLKDLWSGTTTVNSVLHRSFKNFSKMYFSFAGATADRIRGISAKMCCYDKNAFVLTRNGWLPVKDVGFDDELADVNDAGVVEWHKPSAVVRKLHTGEMVTFNHRGSSLRVTGDHKMWANFKVKAKASSEDAYRFIAASELARTETMGFKFTSRAAWKSSAQETVTLPPVPCGKAGNKVELTMPYKAFAELVGWYIAEGNIDRSGGQAFPRIRISQNATRSAAQIAECLQRCGLSFSVQGKHKQVFAVNSIHLGVYCEPLGKAFDKYIPNEFFQDPGLLEPLLNALYLGDASYHPGEHWDRGTLRTRSRRLAEDVQRAWFALGRPAVIHTRWMKPNAESSPAPLYEVCAYKTDYQIYWRADFAKKSRVVVEHVDAEEVYCFTLPNHRPVVKGSFGSIPLLAGQCFDEVQDLDPNHLPVIRETMSHSEYGTGISVYTGTPKTLDNTLEYEWQRSSQAEWMIPCKACNKENYPALGMDIDKMIGPYHDNIGPLRPSQADLARGVKPGTPALVCARCQHWLDARNGRWMHKNPKLRWDYPGYHIPQIIMPIHCENKKRWRKLLGKRAGAENYTTARFYNEVLGISYDTGAKLVSETDLKRAACLPFRNNPKDFRRQQAEKNKYILRVLGVDWGGGGEEEVSFTTGAVIGFTAGGQAEVIYGERLLTPHDPIGEAKRLLQIYKAFDCDRFAHDYNGAGNFRELYMLQAGLPLDRVVPFVYNRTASKDFIVFHKGGDGNNSRNYWLLDKARSLEYICELIKLTFVRFFEYDFVDVDNRGLLRDFLSLVAHKTETARAGEVFSIHRTAAFPDDFAHSVNFACCAGWSLLNCWPEIPVLTNLIMSLEQQQAYAPDDPWTEPGAQDQFFRTP